MASSLGKQLTDHDLEGGLGKGVVLVVHRPFISFPQEELLAKVFEGKWLELVLYRILCSSFMLSTNPLRSRGQ